MYQKIMVVNVMINDGMRSGSFDINGIKGIIPTQAITSTNLNHAKLMNDPTFDFKTKILEIVERCPDNLIHDKTYRKKRISEVKDMIKSNSDKLCFLALNGVKTHELSKSDNISLIDFQIQCGFIFIKAYFIAKRSSVTDLAYYKNKIPKNKYLMAILDEKLHHGEFKKLYIRIYKSGSDIIGFLGRTPTRFNKNIKLNLKFIGSRNDDQILRFTSFIEKSSKNISNPLVYHLFGFDIFSFRTVYGNQNIPLSNLTVCDQFKIIPLTSSSKLQCTVTKQNLYKVAKNYMQYKKSTVPISIYNIVLLNNEFRILGKKYTRKQLEVIASSRLF